jgi:adenylate cyclase
MSGDAHGRAPNGTRRALAGAWRGFASAAGRSPVLRAIGSLCRRYADWGTQPYPLEDQRRLKILNVFAAFVVVATGSYAVQNAFMDFEKYKPIIIINSALLVVAAFLPLLHRIGPIAAGMTLVVCEYVALVAMSAYLGRNAGLHLQYFVAAAATFVVLGPERLRLVLSVVALGAILHLLVWFRFPPELALIDAEPGLTDGLYLQAAIVTMAMIAATIWYAFSLVEQARGETEALLRNILPGSIVERLKSRPGEAIADTFEDASVMFADISGFVPLARRLGARGVVDMLNRLVSEFDALAHQHRLEKIKTIGDAYMAAGGLPERSADHTERLVAMGLEMLGTVARLRAETGLDVKLRIGIASGPLMAGVIGRNKFSYDVWGDTVNLAARLESVGTPGRVLVCPACRERLEGKFEFESMGVVPIKGIGDCEAWFVLAQGVLAER